MVKRYDLDVRDSLGEWKAAIVLDDCGDYVHYEDYAALLAEIEQLKAEVIDLCVAVADAYYETGEYKYAVDAALDIQAALIDAHKGE